MKRYLFAIAALSAAIACSKTEIENDGILPEAEGTSTFRISAVISGDAPDPSSKTEFTPPYKVEWSADDRLWVLVRSGEEYSGHCFVKADGDNNWFEEKNSSLVASEITEYNVIYPFDGSLQSIDPDGYTDSPVTVSAGTQSGIGSGAHVDAPLYGKSTGMEIALAHATALYAVTVKNISAEPVSVTNVTLKNELGRNMNGEFHVNPGTGALKAGASVSPEASLSVTDAVIPGNSEGVFYVTSAPVKFGSGESMTVSATANGDVSEGNKTYEPVVYFKAGAV